MGATVRHRAASSPVPHGVAKASGAPRGGLAASSHWSRPVGNHKRQPEAPGSAGSAWVLGPQPLPRSPVAREEVRCRQPGPSSTLPPAPSWVACVCQQEKGHGPSSKLQYVRCHASAASAFCARGPTKNKAKIMKKLGTFTHMYRLQREVLKRDLKCTENTWAQGNRDPLHPGSPLALVWGGPAQAAPSTCRKGSPGRAAQRDIRRLRGKCTAGASGRQGGACPGLTGCGQHPCA